MFSNAKYYYHMNRQKDHTSHQMFFGILSISTKFSTLRLIFHEKQYEDEIYFLKSNKRTESVSCVLVSRIEPRTVNTFRRT